MKKYKIIKEMPFGPVGMIVKSNEEGDILVDCNPYSSCNSGAVYNKSDVKILISQGWIEEVKEDKNLLEMLNDEGSLIVDPFARKTIVMCARKRAIEIVEEVLKVYYHSPSFKKELISALEKM